MRLATTLVLLILVLGSAGYIIFYERAKPSTAEILSYSGQITRFEPSEIRSITVRGPADVVSLHRGESGSWLIGEPYQDRADPEWVEELLKSASDLQTLETISASEVGKAVKLGDTGLDDGKFEIEFQPADGDPIRLIVGGPTPLKGTTYLQVPGGGKDILIVSADLHPLLSRPSSELRDRRLVRVDAANLTGFSLKSSRGEIEMERGGEDEYWSLTRPLQTRGHREFIDDLLAFLTNAEIAGLASNGNGGDARAFEPSRATVITLKPGGENAEPVTLELSQPTDSEPDKILARISDRLPIFKVDAELLVLLNRSPNDLRDDHIANIDQDAVSAISITDIKGYRSMIRRRGNLWVLGRNGTYEAANYKAINDFFKTLNEEKIIDFVADSSANLEPYGLDRPALRILLAGFPTAPDKPGGDGAGAGESDTGGNAAEEEREIVDLRIGVNLDDGKIYANFVGEPFIYRIGDVVLGVAPADPLKWKALNILRFSYTGLKSLDIARGVEPPISIESNFNVQRFRAEYGGQDVTPLIDKGRLTGLALTLSSLSASNWVTDDPDDIPELKTPTLVLKLVIDHRLPEGGTKTFPVELSFAPTVAGRRTAYFYGKLKSSPEIFLVPYSTYRALAASLIVDPNRPKSPGDYDDGLSNEPLLDPDPPSDPKKPTRPDVTPDPATPGDPEKVPTPADPANPANPDDSPPAPDPAKPEPPDPKPAEPESTPQPATPVEPVPDPPTPGDPKTPATSPEAPPAPAPESPQNPSD